jgi:tRNA threonylcarbamoyladenosine biosynthesis protein TsaB
MAIDTSLDACSVAIFGDDGVVAIRSELIGVGHAERLAPMAADVLDESQLSAEDIDIVGVVVGPGTFAGVRVGVAFARGFVAGGPARAVGVVSLRAIAKSQSLRDGWVCAPVIDARRGFAYLAAYDRDLTLIEPCLAPVQELRQRLAIAAADRDVVWCGPGASLAASDAPAFAAIELAAVAQLARDDGAAAPSPLYLRPPDAAPARPQRFASLFAT